MVKPRGGIPGNHTKKDKPKERRDDMKQPHRHRPTSQQQVATIRSRDPNTIHLDGSTLEGGGQLVRVALTLSALTGIPVHITNIRAGRGGGGGRSGGGSGGLKESHLAALEVLGEECAADVLGAEVGSKEVLFQPGRVRRRREQAETGSVERTVTLQRPGSVWLILQALLPWYLLRLRGGLGRLVLKGGTNVSSSMSGDYVVQVLLPALARIGMPGVRVDVVKRGWAGNAMQIGEVRVQVDGVVMGSGEGRALRAFHARDRGAIEKISVTVVAHPEDLRRALVQRARDELEKGYPEVEVDVPVDEDSGDVRRLYVLLVAHTSSGWRLGRDYLGSGKALKNQKQTDALIEGAVNTVVKDLRAEIDAGGCVDEHLQDQLVVFQALVDGMSAVDAGEERAEGTLHTQTVRWVCQQMLGHLGYKTLHGGQCLGIGTDAPGSLIRLHADRDDSEEGSAAGEEGDAVEWLGAGVGQTTWDDSNSDSDK